jgi:hypothetical protein
MQMLNWFKKTWMLIVIVILATLICGPAAGWIVEHVGAGFAQAALIIDGLAAIALVLLFLDFIFDNRAQWGIFPTLDLDKALDVAIYGIEYTDPNTNEAKRAQNPIACAMVFLGFIALVIAILFLAIPRPGEIPAMQPTAQAELK